MNYGEQTGAMRSANPAKTTSCRRRVLLALLGVCFSAACSHSSAPVSVGSQALTVMSTGQSPADATFLAKALDEYQNKTGVRIKNLAGDDTVNTRLLLLQDLFAKGSAEPDICEIDNIWPGLLGDDLLDLKPYRGDEMTAIDKTLLDAFTVNGRLIALPESVDTSVLYYRTDLLKKYGYRQPPRTWDELGRIAKVIQNGERKARAANFWGYIWQGSEGESLNCNAMEWQRAEGANLIDASRKPVMSSPGRRVRAAPGKLLDGAISPPSVGSSTTKKTRNVLRFYPARRRLLVAGSRC